MSQDRPGIFLIINVFFDPASDAFLRMFDVFIRMCSRFLRMFGQFVRMILQFLRIFQCVPARRFACCSHNGVFPSHVVRNRFASASHN